MNILAIIIVINGFISFVKFHNHANKALSEKSLECRALVVVEVVVILTVHFLEAKKLKIFLSGQT